MAASAESKPTVNRTRFTKARAILAGGVVLGVGAAITLAAWNDSEFATGTFEAGQFNLQGSPDGATFTDHPADAPAELAFEVAAENLTPGDTVYAGYAVQLSANSTYAADVAVIETTSTDAASNIAVEFVYTDEFGCDETAFAAGTNENGTAFSLDGTEAPTNLCIQVNALDTLAQGWSGSVTYEFAAASTEELSAE